MDNTYRSSSARAVIVDQGRVLVESLRSKNICFLPGGTLLAEENPEVALRRELAEELLGGEWSIIRYLGSIGHIWEIPNGIDTCLNYFYEVRLTADDGIRAKEHGRIIRWLPFDDPEFAVLQPPSLRLLLTSTQPVPWNYIDEEIQTR